MVEVEVEVEVAGANTAATINREADRVGGAAEPPSTPR
jgi:hypothetical protein